MKKRSYEIDDALPGEEVAEEPAFESVPEPEPQKASEPPAKKSVMLNRNKPFATVFGNAGHHYEQDGKNFDQNGAEVE